MFSSGSSAYVSRLKRVARSPSPTTISHTSRTRAASRGPNDGSFSFPKDKPGENEDDARRQKTDSVDASDATMTTKEEESVVGSRALAAAEARAARLARWTLPPVA